MQSLGSGIGGQGIPRRAQRSRQHLAVGTGQRGAPCAIRLGKGIGCNFGTAGDGRGGERQLRDGIGHVEHDPSPLTAGNIGQAVLTHNHQQVAHSMHVNNRAGNGGHGGAVNLHYSTATGHAVPVGQQQQPLAGGNSAHGRRVACHLQRLLALAHIQRQVGLAAMCRLTIGKRHHGPGDNPDLSHAWMFVHGTL